MAHAEICPICEGSGFYKTYGEGNQKCHGCYGKGWVTIQDYDIDGYDDEVDQDMRNVVWTHTSGFDYLGDQ